MTNDQAAIQQAAREFAPRYYPRLWSGGHVIDAKQDVKFNLDELVSLLTAFHISRSEEERKRIQELERVIAWANNSLFGSHGFFLPLNGGDDNEHHLDKAIESLKSQACTAEAEVSRLRGALEGILAIHKTQDATNTAWIAVEAMAEAALSSPPASAEREVKG